MVGRPRKYFSKEEEIDARRKRHAELRIRKKEELLAYHREWYINNRESFNKNRREYRSKNKDIINEKSRIWRANNPDKIKLYTKKENSKQRRKLNPLLKFKSNVKSLIACSFKRVNRDYRKILRSEEILGCNIHFFKEYILDKCPDNTEMKDFGQYGYHIDHIIPISTAKTEEEVIKLCHYTNFQPLWWKDNLLKSNKIIEYELQ